MIRDGLSRPASGARTVRVVVALGAVVVSLAACSADGRSGTDSVVAIERAQDEAAAELAEVQAALDRQVEAADAQQAEAQAAADQAARQAAAGAAAEAATKKAAADKAASDKAAKQKAAADRASADRAAADRAAAARRAAPKAAVKAATRPQQRTPAGSTKAAPAKTGADEVRPRAVPAARPVATRPARAAAVPKPAVPGPRPAAGKPNPAPAGLPQGAVVSPSDLDIVVAPGGTVSTAGDESVAAGCALQGFQAGDRVRLTTDSGATVREAVLPACQREVIPAPGTGVAITAPRFRVTLRTIPWRAGDTWVLHIGTHRWPVTASGLSAYGWSVTVTADTGVTAGPIG